MHEYIYNRIIVFLCILNVETDNYIFIIYNFIFKLSINFVYGHNCEEHCLQINIANIFKLLIVKKPSRPTNNFRRIPIDSNGISVELPSIRMEFDENCL